MKINLFIAVFFFVTSAATAQQHTLQFPDTFLGSWKGKLQWTVPGKSSQEFTMQLSILPLDSMGLYRWEIRYGDSSKDIRAYTLQPVDAAKGHWVIDEQNGIVLDNYAIGNCLQGSFTVMGSTIINNYCIQNGQLKVEFFTIRLADKKTSGKGTEDSPLVDSYRMAGYQYGLLEKLK